MWKKIQRWSYAFYALVYVHVLFVYLNKKNVDIKDVVILSVIFGSYTVLRVIKVFSKNNKKTLFI